MDAEKHLTKFNTPSIQYSFMTKPLNKLNTEGNYLPIILYMCVCIYI